MKTDDAVNGAVFRAMDSALDDQDIVVLEKRKKQLVGTCLLFDGLPKMIEGWDANRQFCYVSVWLWYLPVGPYIHYAIVSSSSLTVVGSKRGIHQDCVADGSLVALWQQEYGLEQLHPNNLNWKLDDLPSPDRHNNPWLDPGHNCSEKVKKSAYFIQAGKNGPIKIGVSGDPLGRVQQLQTGHYAKLSLLGTIDGVGKDGEGKLHYKFRHLCIRGEWFRPEPELLSCIAENKS